MLASLILAHGERERGKGRGNLPFEKGKPFS
jgi:hypothetical protein